MPVYRSAEAAVSTIKSGDRVFIHSVAAAPQSPFFIEGALGLLDSPNEYFYDKANRRLYIGRDPASIALSWGVPITAKMRDYCFDLSGSKNSTINHIGLIGCSIKTDAASSGNTLLTHRPDSPYC